MLPCRPAELKYCQGKLREAQGPGFPQQFPAHLPAASPRILTGPLLWKLIVVTQWSPGRKPSKPPPWVLAGVAGRMGDNVTPSP